MTQTKDDTVNLLRECNSGIKMGVSAIDEVCTKVTSDKLKKILEKSKHEHGVLGDTTHKYLNEFNCDTKEPHPMAKAMSWTKTNVMLALNESDAAVADIITQGCNMGIKSLNKYLNEYKQADDKVRKLAQDIINLEEKLLKDVKEYL